MNDSSAQQPLLPATHLLIFDPKHREKKEPSVEGRLNQQRHPNHSPHRAARDQCSQSTERQTQHWYIEGPHRLERTKDRKLVKHRQFLQIATGQWTSPQYATRFPLRKTATLYAREYSFLPSQEVRVISMLTESN
ncbi:MAG: hypothetical protein L7U72_06425 [Rubripirellula sp.]|nr:hypothetical protein [Rubripirellula sp.]